MCGRDDPDVHGHGLGSAHALEGTLLENAQELGLEVQGEIADLVQEQVPPSASSNRPFLVAVAPVKAPFSWPKSSLSRSVWGRAAQLILMNGPPARGEL